MLLKDILLIIIIIVLIIVSSFKVYDYNRESVPCFDMLFNNYTHQLYIHYACIKICREVYLYIYS